MLDKTNFYAESGGQIYDQGIIHVEGSGASFHVTNVQVHGGYVLHVGQVESGTFAVGDKVGTLIDEVSVQVLAHIIPSKMEKMLTRNNFIVK